jgi:hypothetical protein
MGGVIGGGAEFLASGVGFIDLNSVSTRPGRAAMTTMRSDRKTLSKTEWVTKITVQPILDFIWRRSLLSCGA